MFRLESRPSELTLVAPEEVKLIPGNPGLAKNIITLKPPKTAKDCRDSSQQYVLIDDGSDDSSFALTLRVLDNAKGLDHLFPFFLTHHVNKYMVSLVLFGKMIFILL